MKAERIYKLLEKYFACETSDGEEQHLREYFSQGEIDPELLPYEAYFMAVEAERKQQPSKDFDQKLLEVIAREQVKESDIPVRYVPSTAPANTGQIRPLNAWILRAAVVLFLLGGTWWTTCWLFHPEEAQSAGIDWSKYEPETPEEAFLITQEALLTTSAQMQKGTRIALEEIRTLKPLGEIIQE